MSTFLFIGRKHGFAKVASLILLAARRFVFDLRACPRAPRFPGISPSFADCRPGLVLPLEVLQTSCVHRFFVGDVRPPKGHFIFCSATFNARLWSDINPAAWLLSLSFFTRVSAIFAVPLFAFVQKDLHQRQTVLHLYTIDLPRRNYLVFCGTLDTFL